MPTVQLGVFENFKGGDTLLIWGDDAGLSQLQAALRELAVGTAKAMSIHRLPWAMALRGGRLFLSVEAKGRSTMRLSTSGEGIAVDWQCSIEQFSKFADQIASLSSLSCKSGHQYLEGSPDQPLQVMISKGEYPTDLI